MADENRLKIGFLFNFNPKWMGGIVYLLNSIKILNFLEDDKKPLVYIFFKPSLKKFVDEISYPYQKQVMWNFPSVYNGYIKSWLTRRNVFVDKLVNQYKLSAVYPLHDFPVKSNLNAKLVCWYADLQHLHYPEFFSKRKRLERNSRIKFFIKNSNHLVVSSQAVKDDFYKYFKVPPSLNVHIYRFVSIIDELPQIHITELRKKYNLPEKYFMISNQFHKHKNHKVVFKALAELKKVKPKIHFVLTGRFPDEPNSPYMEELHKLVNENDLKQNISFLGLIHRGDQLMLMKYSQAIIQPSLFEGWSTVIEDAKSLQVPVIASDLPVNIEQLQEKGSYFSPHDHKRLIEILKSYPERDFNKKIYEDYEVRMKNAAQTFISIFQ